MLVIGRIEMARRQHHAHRPRRGAARRDRLHRLEQPVGIAVDRLDAIFAEQFGAQPHHRLAVFEHVAHPRGRARIVLEHEEFIRPGPHQIDAADMRPDAVRRAHAGDLRAELRIAEDEVLRQHALLEDAALAIDIVEEGVDRIDPLHQPFGQARPFVGEEDTRDDVERDDPFARVGVAIDREGDAELAEGVLRRLLPPAQFVVGRLLQPAPEGGQCRTRRRIAVHPHDLVERRSFPHRNGKAPHVMQVPCCGETLRAQEAFKPNLLCGCVARGVA